jgi:enoyl-CoA hydratase/carnithine racemase
LVAEQLTGNGFIQAVVEPGKLEARAIEVASRVADLAPLAVAGMKQLVREAPDAAAIQQAAGVCAESEDVREGLAAMREKRKPVFMGR